MNYKKLSQVLKYSGSTTEEDFHRQLEANPDDHTTRMVLADWLQEHDDPRAEGYRALGKRGHIPYHNRHMEDFSDPESAVRHSYAWANHNYNPSKLPEDWFDLIPHKPGNRIAPNWKENYNSQKEAEDAAALAFGQLSPERKEELLK